MCIHANVDWKINELLLLPRKLKTRLPLQMYLLEVDEDMFRVQVYEYLIQGVKGDTSQAPSHTNHKAEG